MNREQKLIDIVFEVALVISDERYGLRDMPIEEKAAWISKQLESCGFKTVPMGASWGILT